MILRCAVDLVGELGERLQAVAGPGLGHVGPEPCACCFFVAVAFSASKSLLTSMWAYQTSRLRAAANCCIRARYSATPAMTISRRSAGVNPRSRPAISKLAASRLTSHSHGPGSRLVEVVDVEHQLPLRGGEHPEVRQVGVAADLGVQARAWGRGEVGRHDQRRTPVEGERRDHHPSVAEGDQLGHPGRALLLEQRDRVRAVRRRFPSSLAAPGCPVARSPTSGRALLGVQVNHAPRVRTPCPACGCRPDWRQSFTLH